MIMIFLKTISKIILWVMVNCHFGWRIEDWVSLFGKKRRKKL